LCAANCPCWHRRRDWDKSKLLREHLHPRQSRSRVHWHTGSPAFVAASGASRGVPLGSQRLSSSKGQTRRETGTQSHGPRYLRGRQAAEGYGQAKSPSVPERENARYRSGDWLTPVTSRLALLFQISTGFQSFSTPSFFQSSACKRLPIALSIAVSYQGAAAWCARSFVPGVIGQRKHSPRRINFIHATSQNSSIGEHVLGAARERAGKSDAH
jgi:hypothetical protein